MSVGAGGSGQYTYEWVRQNSSVHQSGWYDPWTIGTSTSVSVDVLEDDLVGFGPSFMIKARIYGTAGQMKEEVISVNVIGDGCMFC